MQYADAVMRTIGLNKILEIPKIMSDRPINITKLLIILINHIVFVFVFVSVMYVCILSRTFLQTPSKHSSSS